MSYEFAKKEIGEYRITIYQDEDANHLAQNGIWLEFTSGTIPTTDTTEVCLVVAAAKLTLKMQRML